MSITSAVAEVVTDLLHDLDLSRSGKTNLHQRLSFKLLEITILVSFRNHEVQITLLQDKRAIGTLSEELLQI